MKYEVIDNFLDKEYFVSLKRLFANKENTELGEPMPLPLPVGWEFEPDTVTAGGKKILTEDKFFYMVHRVYDMRAPLSSAYNELVPLLDKLKMKALLRVKANLYPNTEMIHEHPMHRDYTYSHTGVVFSLNTCDGYTKLKDGTKINSVANRILIFDASEKHCSTTTTNVKARFNLNINYL
jgi:hypothetical protein